MIKYVLDTDVVIAAYRSPTGASAALLGAVLENKVQILANVPLFIEYEAKCTLETHRQAAGLSLDQAYTFIDGLAALIHPVHTHFLWRPTLRDENDEMVLEAALNGGADAIVTFNMRDYAAATQRFNIEILTPACAIRRLRNE